MGKITQLGDFENQKSLQNSDFEKPNQKSLQNSDFENKNRNHYQL